jgi:hypothetical protein
MLKDAAMGRGEVGEHLASMVQLAPAETAAQLLFCRNWLLSAPVRVIPVIESGALPIFLIVMTRALLVVKVTTLPKEIIAGLIAVFGARGSLTKIFMPF